MALGAHAVRLLDRAGWHTTTTLPVPNNSALRLLPARPPEPSPVENLWQFLRDNWLGSRIFQSYAAVVTLPIRAALAESIATSQTGDLTFIISEHGRALTKESFRNLFRTVCRDAGVP